MPTEEIDLPEAAVLFPRDNVDYNLIAPITIRVVKGVVSNTIFRVTCPEGVNPESAITLEGEDFLMNGCHIILDIAERITVPEEPALKRIKSTGRSIRMLDNKI